jgi:hypothetical protein
MCKPMIISLLKELRNLEDFRVYKHFAPNGVNLTRLVPS